MKKLGRSAGIVLTFIITAGYVITSLTPYFSPEHYPVAAVTALAYLPMLILYLCMVLVWFFIRRKTALLLVLIFFTGYQSFMATMAFKVFNKKWTANKTAGSLRVMSWNINELGSATNAADTTRLQMLAFIRRMNADVICVQDASLYQQKDGQGFPNNLADIMQQGGYRYSIFPSFDAEIGAGSSKKLGVAIFTRLPLIHAAQFTTSSPEKAGYIDLLYHNKPLRIFAAHLSSMSLWPNTRNEAGIKYLEGDSTKIKTKTIFTKLIEFGKLHGAEANIIKNRMNKSPYPVLFAADLNSVPASYVYHHLRKGLKDAFLTKDYGIGGTYNRVFPKIRIDVLFYSPQLEVVQFTRPTPDFSDHFPIVADFKWKE